MPDNTALIQEKLNQATAILEEQEIDIWLTFVRETSLSPDPCLDLILGLDMVWQSAFLITRDNQRIAIVGSHDAENIHNIDGYTTVIPYVEDIRAPLVETLLDLNPAQIALNYSENDVASDGLAHGLMLLLKHYLADTDLAERFVSAEPIIQALRGRKSAGEIERIREAIATTQTIFKQIDEHLQPGLSETAVAEFVHNIVQEKKLDTAWEWAYCPVVDAGPESPIGHAGPQDKYKVEAGKLVHVDFGVKQDSFCADLQRVWYIRKEYNDQPPEAIQQAFDAARKALLAGFEALKPGTQGWEVDAAARKTLVDAGYAEYKHAFGHQLGRNAHDGGTSLAPRWERYGQTPYGLIEENSVYAIELGIELENYGYIGLEENVLVTASGAEWLSAPQEELWLI